MVMYQWPWEDDRNDAYEHRALRRLLHIASQNDEIIAQLVTVQDQLKELGMGQAEIDAAVAALQNDETGLDASVLAIQAEIAALNAGGVNTDALTAEVANLATHVASVAALAPAPPPPPAP